MPIISNKKPTNSTVKITIDKDVLDNVEKYCEIFKDSIDSIDGFFNEAAKLVFSKDSDWKNYQKNLKSNETKK